MLQQPEHNSQKIPEVDHLQNLGSIIASYLNFGGKHPGKKTPEKPSRQHNPGKLSGYIRLLKLAPWLLGCVFIFSFFWDFNSVQAVFLGNQLHFEGLLRMVSVAGFIGFLTNWLAIAMLFKPLHKRPLLGQGLIPAHKNRIAWRLASAVSDDIINTQLIQQKIDDSKAVEMFRLQAIRHIRNLAKREDFRADLKAWLLRYLESVVEDEEFRKKISGSILKDLDQTLQHHAVERLALQAYTFFKGRSLNDFIEELIDGLPASAEKNLNLVDDYLDKLPEKFEHRSRQIEDAVKQVIFQLVNQLDVQQLAQENLNKYDERRLEKMIKNATNEHLKVIQYLGAILGTIGGFVIWEPVISLAALAIIAGIVLLADHQIYHFRKKPK